MQKIEMINTAKEEYGVSLQLIEMDNEFMKQHGIILSTYYHNGLKPGGFNDPAITYDIDLIELLLIMDTVFEIKHYELLADSKEGTALIHTDKYRCIYDPLITKHDFFSTYKVLCVNKDEHYNEGDYEKVKEHGMASNNLFYYNMLTTYVNCEKEIESRRSYNHFQLFDNKYQQQGKLLINYLKNKLVMLVKRLYDSEQYGDPRKLIECMVRDYGELDSLYKDAESQLRRMLKRTYSIGESFNDFFQNEVLETKDYIKMHRKLLGKETFIDFIFTDSKGYLDNALTIIDQIVRIASVYNLGELSDSWGKCLHYSGHDDISLEMTNVNNQLKELETNGKTGGFDIIGWGEKYIALLEKVFEVI